MAAVSFNSKKVKEALATYFEIVNKKTSKGESFMKKNNNIFGMNFELGLSKDPNIAATLMGVAVKNPENGNWYTYDTVNNTRKNIANFKMGNLPIFLLPTKVLNIGDLIKKDKKYFYVKAVNANSTITLLGATDGIIQEMLTEESIIPGMTIYTKVVAFDTKSLVDTSSKENMGSNVLAAMCMMNWSKGNDDDFSLDNIDDNSFNGLGACLPMIMAMGGNNNLGNIFIGQDGNINFATLMMLGSNSGEDEKDNMTQMLVLSQLLGGNNSNGFGNLIPSTSPTFSTKSKLICEKCGAPCSDGANFCSKCGGKAISASKKCTKCGADLKLEDLYCGNCGSKVVQSVCPNCGKTLADDAKFCTECGTSLNSEVPPSDADTVKSVKSVNS